MMEHFAPLSYLGSTVTAVHVALWLAIPLLIGVVLPLRQGKPVMWSWLPAALIMLPVMYGVLALMFGQLFGDKFTLEALWPSAALLGGVFLGIVVLRSDPPKRPPVGFALFGIAFGAGFFTFALWLLPRVAGLGLIDFPKLSWGVQV